MNGVTVGRLRETERAEGRGTGTTRVGAGSTSGI